MGKRVEISTMEGSYWRGFGGEQSPSDLETALQLIYRLFTTRVHPVPAELATCLRSKAPCGASACPARSCMGALQHPVCGSLNKALRRCSALATVTL